MGMGRLKRLKKIKKEKNGTLHNFVQCSCKNIEQKCMVTERVTENVSLTPALMDDVTE